jgi:PAS domain S-box-containing protein
MGDSPARTTLPAGEHSRARHRKAVITDGTVPHTLSPDEVRGLLASIVQSSDDAIIGEWLDGTVFSWSAGAERLYGYSADEVLGRSVAVIFPPQRRSELVDILERVSRGERIGPWETVRIRKDGEPVPISLTVSAIRNEAGKIIAASAVGRDLTHQKRAEDRLQAAVEERTIELAEANRLLRLEVEQRRRAEAALSGENRVLELIAAGASLSEALEAVCRTVEARHASVRCGVRTVAEDPSGGQVARVVGHPAIAGLPADFPPNIRRRCVIADARAEPGLKAWARRTSLQAVWAEPIVGSTWQTLGTVVTGYPEPHEPAEDELKAGTAAARLAGIVLARARAEDRARRQLAELAHVSRMATMGEMASGLAHELNQPLCAIVNYTEACLEMLGDKSATAEVRRAMVEVAKQSERAGEVIRRLRGRRGHEPGRARSREHDRRRLAAPGNPGQAATGQAAAAGSGGHDPDSAGAGEPGAQRDRGDGRDGARPAGAVHQDAPARRLY